MPKLRPPCPASSRNLKSPNRMKNLNGMKPSGTEALRKKFLKCFGVRAGNAAALRQAVKGLIDQGVCRKTLLAWAVQAGHTQGYASNLLSKILCAIGLRERRPGAGPKSSPEALELLALAETKYGERFLKVLRAAWRTGKARMTARVGNTVPHSGRATKAILAPPLGSRGAYHGSMLSGTGKQRRGAVPASVSLRKSFSKGASRQPTA
jgi:hypothetical protein